MLANLSTIKKRLKTKIKSCGDEATDFHDEGMPKVDSNYLCLSVIFSWFFRKKDENSYWQVFSKECRYTEKKKKEGD